MSRIHGVGFLCPLMLVLIVDVADRLAPLPFVYHAKSGITAYVRDAYVSIERVPTSVETALMQEGHRKITIGRSAPPRRPARYGGLLVPLLWLELIAGIIAGKFVVSPWWRRCVRRSSGRCETCGYQLRGLHAAVCPECGTRFRRVVAATQATLPQSRRRRFVCALVPFLVPCVLVGAIHAALSTGRRTLDESWLAPNSNASAFLLARGQAARVRHNGGLALIEIFECDNAQDAYRCRTRYWADEDSVCSQAPDICWTGELSERAGLTLINAGPWTFQWSVCDASRHWIYRPGESFTVELYLGSNVGS